MGRRRENLVRIRTRNGWTNPMPERELQEFLERTGTAHSAEGPWIVWPTQNDLGRKPKK